MAKSRFGLLAVLAATVASMIVPSCASAHAYFIEGKELTSNETVEVAGTEDGMEFTAGSTKVIMICGNNASVGKLEASGKSVVELYLGSCTLDEVGSKGSETFLEACTVAEPVEFKTKGELIGTKGPVEVELKPETGTLFTTLELTGASCALKGKYEVSGSQICSQPDGEAQNIDHELLCTESGGKLEIGKEKEAEKDKDRLVVDDGVTLNSHNEWYAN
jgi:hypothetical protein